MLLPSFFFYTKGEIAERQRIICVCTHAEKLEVEQNLPLTSCRLPNEQVIISQMSDFHILEMHLCESFSFESSREYWKVGIDNCNINRNVKLQTRERDRTFLKQILKKYTWPIPVKLCKAFKGSGLQHVLTQTKHLPLNY